MKKYIPHPAKILRLLLWLPVYFLTGSFTRKAVILLLMISSFSLSGCYLNFYTANTKNSASDSEAMKALKNSRKYFIVHFKDADFRLNNIAASDSIIEGDLTIIEDLSVLLYLAPHPNSTYSYKKKYEPDVLQEVHIYTSENYNPEQKEHIRLPVNSVTRVDIYTKNQSRTTVNHILSTAGLITAPFIIAGVIAAIACNCPQVYTYDGGEYQFKSGVFSGAVYSSLERTDYLPLSGLTDKDGKFMFRLMNNQNEEQYINQVQLAAVTHHTGENVLLDKYGVPHTYSNAASPAAKDNTGNDITDALLYPDGKTFSFDTRKTDADPYSNAILNFKKPANARIAKLIVHAKNTMWSGYVFDQFSSLFGKQYQQWQAKQDKANSKDQEQWLTNQSLPLMVYVETKEGWQYADYFPMTGNTAGRDMIMQIKLPEIISGNVRIKIASAYMFWEMDYAAMDFSDDADCKVDYLDPSLTNHTSPGILKDELLKKDGGYAKLNQNEYLEMAFLKPEAISDRQTDYFLVSSGYYHRITPYKGIAKLSQLYQFRNPGSFDDFSRAKFEEARLVLAKGLKTEKAGSNN